MARNPAVSKRGHGGIEPPTSPTLKENHTTRPMPRAPLSHEHVAGLHGKFKPKQKEVLGVGFEPTPPGETRT